MTTTDYLLAALIMGGVTFALRAFPFIARHWIAHHPRIQVLGCLLYTSPSPRD